MKLSVRNLHKLHEAILVDSSIGSGPESILEKIQIVSNLIPHDAKKIKQN